MSTNEPTGWFSGRTRFFTVASMATVAAAGAIAVGANIGILNAAADTNVGTLSAAGTEPAAAPPQIVDVYVTDPPASTTTVAAPVVQEFAVDTAGTVTLSDSGSILRLESVSPSAGWAWSLSQNDPTALTVSFTDGARTLQFHATLDAAGIAARVDETIVGAPAPNAPQPPTRHDEYEGGDDDD
jgi:hypothetical protein